MMSNLIVCLFEPEIPPNTGNIIRLCANSGTQLHLIEPLGFSLEEKDLRRSSLDYEELCNIRIHSNWDCFVSDNNRRLLAVSTKGTRRYDLVEYKKDDVLIFGPETRGLPETILKTDLVESSIYIPMAPKSRSLNLSNAVAIILFEAWRQSGFVS